MSVSAKGIPLGFAGLDIPAGSHIAYTSSSEEERQGNLLDFVAAGLQNDEKCILAMTEYAGRFWIDGLRARGIDPDSLPKGQMKILTAKHLLNGSVSESMHVVEEEINDALDENWESTRVCISLYPLFHNGDAVPQWLTADARLNDLVAGKPISLLCPFNKALIHPEFLGASIQCHPMITDGTSLSQNEVFTSNNELLDNLPSMVDQMRQTGAFDALFARLGFYGDTPVIHAGNELDLYTAPMLENLTNMLIQGAHQELIIDLTDTRFIDASSIGAIIRSALKMEERNGRLAILDPSDPPRKVFRLLELQDRIPIHTCLNEAFYSFGLPDTVMLGG